MIDTDYLAVGLLEACRMRGWKLVTAESCTGGLLSGAITAIAGSSDVFDRGFITYSNAAKIDMLGVRPETLRRHGAVSEAVALEMAAGALRASRADLALSVTGIAGPGGSDDKPEGRVCFGVALGTGASHAELCDFGPAGRDNVRNQSVRTALQQGMAAASG